MTLKTLLTNTLGYHGPPVKNLWVRDMWSGLAQGTRYIKVFYVPCLGKPPTVFGHTQNLISNLSPSWNNFSHYFTHPLQPLFSFWDSDTTQLLFNPSTKLKKYIPEHSGTTVLLSNCFIIFHCCIHGFLTWCAWRVSWGSQMQDFHLNILRFLIRWTLNTIWQRLLCYWWTRSKPQTERKTRFTGTWA